MIPCFKGWVTVLDAMLKAALILPNVNRALGVSYLVGVIDDHGLLGLRHVAADAHPERQAKVLAVGTGQGLLES